MQIRDLGEALRASGDGCLPTQPVLVRFPDQSMGFILSADIVDGEFILTTATDAPETEI